MDRVSVEEGDLKKVLYAQFKGTPVQIGESVINGKNIISIMPDYHRYTGWYESYEPKEADDWEQIKRDCPKFDGIIEYHKDKMLELVRTNQINRITEKEEYKQIVQPDNQFAGQLTDGINKF